jgi:transcriptional regulator with XRE-family HTH domain
MAAAQRKQADPPPHTAPEPAKKTRNDPERLKAFARRLNIMMNELGLPERARARHIRERVGVSGTTAANWLKGEGYPSFEELERLAQLGVDPHRFLPDSADLARTNATTTIPLATVTERLAQLIESKQFVPLSQLRTDDREWDHTALPNSIWRQALGSDMTGLVVYCMKGDAMADRIRDGTPLLVNTGATQIIDDNAIYALQVGDGVIVRRVQRRLQGGYVIVCDNPAIAPENIDRLRTDQDGTAKRNDVIVLGRVVMAMQRL